MCFIANSLFPGGSRFVRMFEYAKSKFQLNSKSLSYKLTFYLCNANLLAQSEHLVNLKEFYLVLVFLNQAEGTCMLAQNVQKLQFAQYHSDAWVGSSRTHNMQATGLTRGLNNKGASQR